MSRRGSVLARSIWTHASKEQIERMLASFASVAPSDGLLLTSYRPARALLRGDYAGDTWVGRGPSRRHQRGGRSSNSLGSPRSAATWVWWQASRAPTTSGTKSGSRSAASRRRTAHRFSRYCLRAHPGRSIGHDRPCWLAVPLVRRSGVHHRPGARRRRWPGDDVGQPVELNAPRARPLPWSGGSCPARAPAAHRSLSGVAVAGRR